MARSIESRILRKSPVNTKWIKIVVGCFLIGVCIALTCWILSPNKDRTRYPFSMANLMGVWISTHPQYANRYLQFTDDSIVFGRGGEASGSYTVDAMDWAPTESGKLVRITYSDDESTEYQLNFSYVPQNGGMIWMKNNKQAIWRRTSTQPLH